MIEQTIHIPNTTAKELYELLLSSEKHSALIGDEAVVSDKINEPFTTFSGYAEGKNTVLVPYSRIVQTWRASDWPKNHYSIITFELSDTINGAAIHFMQKDIPSGREDEYRDGWQDNYWDPLFENFSP